MLMPFVILAVLFLAASLPAAPGGGAFLTVKGEGYAVKFDSTSDMRRLAVESAYKSAVAAAIKQIVGEGVYKNQSDIFAVEIVPKAESFVTEYKVLSIGWMRHFDMPEAEALIKSAGSNVDAESGKKIEEGGPDETTGGAEGANEGGVMAMHVVIEAKVDLKALTKDVRRFAAVPDEKSGTVILTIIGLGANAEFEELKERISKLDYIVSLSYSSFTKSKITLSALTSETGSAFYERMSKDLGSDYAVIPGGENKVIIKSERKGR